jgi:hypothetical protein
MVTQFSLYSAASGPPSHIQQRLLEGKVSFSGAWLIYIVGTISYLVDI